MRKFLLRFFAFLSGLMALLVVYGTAYILITAGKPRIADFPGNYVSNSSCFNAKVDQLVHSENFSRCSFLIAGSSMSLCNISGKQIAEETKQTVYNISAWGIKPAQVTELLRATDNKNVKTLLLAFNNSDFGELTNNIDFTALDHFIHGNKLRKIYLLLKQMSYKNFLYELSYRTRFSQISNHYESLHFDETGSVQLVKEGFIVDEKKMNTYFDTTGFSTFQSAVWCLDSVCRMKNIRLITVYLPTRPALLRANRPIENAGVALTLNGKFSDNFIDLHAAEIPEEMYCDGIHLFKEGAEKITQMVLDSMGKKNLPVNNTTIFP